MTQEGKWVRYNAGRSNGAASSVLAMVPPWRAGARRGSVAGREEQRAMCAVLHRNPATRRIRRVEVGVRSLPGGCCDTLALGSGQTTRRTAVPAGVHTSRAEGQHNGAHAGQISVGAAMPATGRPKMVQQKFRRAHGWPALRRRGQCRPGMNQSGGSVASHTSVSVCLCVCVARGGGGHHGARLQSFGWQGADYLVPPPTHVCVTFQQASFPVPGPHLAQHPSLSLR